MRFIIAPELGHGIKEKNGFSRHLLTKKKPPKCGELPGSRFPGGFGGGPFSGGVSFRSNRLVGYLLAVECSSSPVSPSPSLSPALIAAANFDLRD